jgi:hypothetical protein
MRNIDEMHSREGAVLPQIVTLRMIEALEEAISSEALQAHIPGQILAGLTLETSNQMQSLITPPAEDDSSDD